MRLTREYFVKQGSIGGKTAAKRMTPEQRRLRAQKASKASHAKKVGQK